MAALEVAADKIASNRSIFSNRSIRPSERISSTCCIDSVRLGGWEFAPGDDETPPMYNPNTISFSKRINKFTI